MRPLPLSLRHIFLVGDISKTVDEHDGDPFMLVLSPTHLNTHPGDAKESASTRGAPSKMVSLLQPAVSGMCPQKSYTRAKKGFLSVFQLFLTEKCLISLNVTDFLVRKLKCGLIELKPTLLSD